MGLFILFLQEVIHTNFGIFYVANKNSISMKLVTSIFLGLFKWKTRKRLVIHSIKGLVEKLEPGQTYNLKTHTTVRKYLKSNYEKSSKITVHMDELVQENKLMVLAPLALFQRPFKSDYYKIKFTVN